ncbi:pyridoxamine 5'-phosphate oxidase family protein [Streptomyces rhizosphaerihabitans]|uniref:pyridoxamine 5'-phosphate oxidase family protein n=1 Tax=Streptomyces rhizosphaerihabitans TaxID=1266770 RepID=UPI0028F6EF1D|nr:pyridoxamine 5'-phosphate oxidase family protein [Streptomyces rhizosphaerihabitans]
MSEFGRLVMRTPLQAAAVRSSVTDHVDEVRSATGTGWTVTVAGPAEVITDPNEAAHYRRALACWSHGPHDAIVRIHPPTASGSRLPRGTEG